MTTMALSLALLLAAPQGGGSPPTTSDDVAVGAPIARGNLAFYPLRPRQARPDARELATLDEAIRRGDLKVVEQGGGGSVNALAVENLGREPVLLLAGELLLGGKQDRMVGRSMVLAPGARAQVQVFCVEHGRWSGGGAFAGAGAMGHARLRKTALGGDQRQVWAEVAESNRKLGTATSSDTYRAAAAKLAGDVGAEAREISAALAREEGAAGVAVAIGGEVVAMEWFASPATFARVREKLVASWVAEARTGRQPRASAPPPAPAAVSAFAAKAERGEAVVDRVQDRESGAALQTTYLRK